MNAMALVQYTARFPAQCAVLLLLAACHQISASILAASSLQQCVASSATDVQCSKKMVVTVSVGSGQNLATQTLDFQLACVGSPTGSCPCPCNYATDPTCTCRDLASPLSITVTKTPVWATYPLQYLQSFNYKPVEVILRPSSRVCLDGDFEPNPTCGWYYIRGNKVSDSQGFTCSCSTSQIFDTTFGGSNQRTRANLDCDFWSDPLDILIGKVPCSAHCLQLDPLWYSGYQLGSASLYMTINIAISMSGPSSNSTGAANATTTASTEVIQVSPSVPTALSSSKLVSAQLLGDLAMYTQLPVLSSMVLLVPQPTGASPDQILTTDRSTWLLVDPSMVSFDGSTCDRVGTSFTAFKWQAGGCGRAPQVCLSNQIKDLIAADQARIQAGRVPLYLATRYTYGANSTLASFSSGPVSFALPVTSASTSLLTLTVSADSVQFTVNTATGVVNSAVLCTFENAVCGGFEAGASRGFVWVNVTNTGSLAAAFTITINNCTGNVLPIEARTVSLAPGRATLLTPPIPLYVTDTQADTNRSCLVTVLDSQGRVSDRTLLRFYTNATIYSDNPNGGYNGTGDGAGEAKGAVDCDKVCSNAMDVICFVANGCWGRFGGFLGIIGGVVTAIALLLVAAKLGMLASCMASVARLIPCGGSSGGTSNHPQRHSARFFTGSTDKTTAATAGAAAAGLARGSMMYSSSKGKRGREPSFVSSQHGYSIHAGVHQSQSIYAGRRGPQGSIAYPGDTMLAHTGRHRYEKGVGEDYSMSARSQSPARHGHVNADTVAHIHLPRLESMAQQQRAVGHRQQHPHSGYDTRQPGHGQYHHHQQQQQSQQQPEYGARQPRQVGQQQQQQQQRGGSRPASPTRHGPRHSRSLSLHAPGPVELVRQDAARGHRHFSHENPLYDARTHGR